MGLVILSLLFYGGLFLYQSNLKKNLESIESEILIMDSRRDAELEGQILNTDKRINLLKDLFQNHLYWTGIFEKLEELTIPEVYFSKAKLTLSSGKLEVNVEGSSRTYSNLARQMVSFQEDSSVEKVNVSGISLDEEKGIRFNLLIIFSKNILLKKQNND